MIKIGLTGSIGMGKSTTAAMFAARGVPVWDADAAVHRLYSPDGAGAEAISRLFPSAVTAEGVDRSILKTEIARDPSALKSIEAVIHPLVAADRAAFVAEAEASGAKAVLLDIPLLFETGSADQMDLVVVVSASPEAQRARVLARPGMTEAQFDTILAKQTPDAEKRARADIVISSETLDSAEAGVDTVMQHLSENQDA
ncbi:dephospho-CoA kinase [Dinoroseobacter sp. S124A]|uniref:dephospho-CoA kinase n=1 Tax=Dinoroseobacter sp. S124A TaxID=3415128 RepID=UPI003C7C2470